MMAVLGTSVASAAQQGTIGDLHPPGNNGSSHGVGFIEGDTSGKGRQFFVFKSTSDPTSDPVFQDSLRVTFDIAHGRVATNVKIVEDDPLGCTPPDDPTCR